MKRTTLPFATAAIAALLLTGCAKEGPNTESTGRESGAMPGMQEPTQDRAEHSAEGTINSVDA